MRNKIPEILTMYSTLRQSLMMYISRLTSMIPCNFYDITKRMPWDLNIPNSKCNAYNNYDWHKNYSQETKPSHFKWLSNTIKTECFYLQHESLTIERVGLMNFVEGKDIVENPTNEVSDSSNIRLGRMDTKVYSFPTACDLVPRDKTSITLWYRATFKDQTSIFNKCQVLLSQTRCLRIRSYLKGSEYDIINPWAAEILILISTCYVLGTTVNTEYVGYSDRFYGGKTLSQSNSTGLGHHCT